MDELHPSSKYPHRIPARNHGPMKLNRMNSPVIKGITSLNENWDNIPVDPTNTKYRKNQRHEVGDTVSDLLNTPDKPPAWTNKIQNTPKPTTKPKPTAKNLAKTQAWTNTPEGTPPKHHEPLSNMESTTITHTCPSCDKTYNLPAERADKHAQKSKKCLRCGEQLNIIGNQQQKLIQLTNNITGKNKAEDIYHRTGTEGLLKLLSYDHNWQKLATTPTATTLWNHLPEKTRNNWLTVLHKRNLL